MSYAASHRAVRELKADGLLPAEDEGAVVEVLEQPDRAGPSGRETANRHDAGLQVALRPAAITIAGIELMHRIRKGQFGLGRLGVQGRLAPAVWNAVLQA